MFRTRIRKPQTQHVSCVTIFLLRWNQDKPHVLNIFNYCDLEMQFSVLMTKYITDKLEKYQPTFSYRLKDIFSENVLEIFLICCLAVHSDFPFGALHSELRHQLKLKMLISRYRCGTDIISSFGEKVWIREKSCLEVMTLSLGVRSDRSWGHLLPSLSF